MTARTSSQAGGSLASFDISGALDDPAELRRRLARDSFLLIRRLLDQSLIYELRAQVLARLASVGWVKQPYDLEEPLPAGPAHHDRGVMAGRPVADPGWRAGYTAVQSLEGLHALAHRPELLQVLSRLFGETPVVHPRKIARIGFPGIAFPTPPHQDALFNETAADVVTAWIPLGCCTAQAGALRVLRGSANDGVLEPRPDDGLGGESVPVRLDDPRWVIGDYAPGDVILFHSRTVHMAPPNQMGSLRLSVDARYQSAQEPFKAAALMPHGHSSGQLPGWRELTAGWTTSKWVEIDRPIRLVAVAPTRLPPSRLVPEPEATPAASAESKLASRPGNSPPARCQPGQKAATQLVGRTPLLELANISAGLPHRIFAKCEFTNPAGSVKDRIGFHIIRRAEEAGLITPGSTLVEATAGNTGIALAAAAAGRYRLILTMSTKMGQEKEAMVRAWGAEVVRCPYEVGPDDDRSFINTARRIAEELPGGYYVNQFANEWNVEAHLLTTGPEIYEQVPGDLGALVAGAGTGGTIMGVTRFLHGHQKYPAIVLADPEGSILAAHVRSCKSPGAEKAVARGYAIEGIGGDFVPPLLDASLVTHAVTVPDAESVAMCLRLQREEGLFVGGSSGCAVAAAVRVAQELAGPPSAIVVMVADSGHRYASTIYNESWRAARGFGNGDQE
jgi:cystathionine beta-synthase